MLDAFDADFPVNCVEYSSLQSHTERSRALESFRRRESTVLVASDAATRGLDVEVRLGPRRARHPAF
jgi:superfamily II DNA/RNA helicase